MHNKMHQNRRLRAVAPTLGLVFVFVALLMLIPWAIALSIGGRGAEGMALSAAIAGGLGALLLAVFGRRSSDIRPQDAILIVVSSWVGVSALGTLPYVFTGALPPLDALFESVSGFTTTGATVLAEIEKLPRALLFWRSLTHWLGGMGILVFAIAILPLLQSSGYQLFKMEAPALEQERMYPRMVQTARATFAVYLTFTVAQTVLLVLGGMSLFDSLCHSFGTLATGGFSTRNASVGAYGSVYIEVIVIVFMVLGSLPFGVHHRGLRNPTAYLQSAQVRLHLTLLLLAAGAVTLDLWGRDMYQSFAQATRYGAFQVVSIMTTTGFATTDTEVWSSFSQFVLIGVSFIGGCTGSTSGAIKTFRFLVLMKLVSRQLLRLVYPHAVKPIRVGQQIIDEHVAESAAAFLFVFVFVLGAGVAALTAMGADGLTALTAALGTLGAVGPGFGAVGPYDNYGWMPDGSKAVCIVLMILGRLEILTVAVLLMPAFWRKG